MASSEGTMSELRTCRSCSRLFEITAAERAWFEERDLRLPMRCQACRKWRRELAREAAAERLRDEERER